MGAPTLRAELDVLAAPVPEPLLHEADRMAKD